MVAYIQDATVGFKNSSAYDNYRPTYPAEAVDGLLEQLGVKHKYKAKIVDLAAGTGKFTEALSNQDEDFEIVAVEPVESMREMLSAKRLRNVHVRNGIASETNISDSSMDAVIAAQAFHWFATEEALAEIRRILKPNGKLGMIWTIEDYNQPRSWEATTSWEKGLKEQILELPLMGPPRFREEKWLEVFDRQAATTQPMFSSPIGTEKISFTIWLNREALWNRVNTLSQVSILEGGARESFEAKFRDLINSKDTEWNEKKETPIHGSLFYAWTTRL